MFKRFKDWAESNVEVNCAWYYVLLGAFVAELVWDIALWLI